MQGIDIVEQNIADLSIDLLRTLLKDRTTGKYITWGTDNYESNGKEYQANQEIKPSLITGDNTEIIQPRVSKSKEEQSKRTRDKAEVFTPSWICNAQNNLIDDAWFGRGNVFNKTDGKKWRSLRKKVVFPDNKIWQDYIEDVRLEISCGEAPYLVSRYDTVTGGMIPINDRIGLLDRKLRIISENMDDRKEWYKWATIAFKCVYGYDYQGDNVLIARENLLTTFVEYYVDKFEREPLVKEMKEIATIISWNIWQMDGLTYTVPYSEQEVKNKQYTIFDYLKIDGPADSEPIPCKIYDWKEDTEIEFKSLMKGE
jgi:hypothetical protein